MTGLFNHPLCGDAAVAPETYVESTKPYEEAVTSPQQTEAAMVQQQTEPVDTGSSALVNTLFVIVPLLLATLAALIGLVVIRKRKTAVNAQNLSIENEDCEDRGEA